MWNRHDWYLFLLVAILCISWSTVALSESRYALIVGHNMGNVNEDPLRYAEDDARRMRNVLVEIGGVSPQNSHLLIAPSAAELSDAIKRLASRLQGNRGSDASVVFVYFAGHGDHDTLHLGREKYSRSQFTRETDCLAADVKIVIIDACQTLRTGRPMGVHAGAGFNVSIAKSATVKGAVTIQSSKVGEPAHESDHLSGALFTHYLLSALRGVADANGDGKVTLLEAYYYAYHHTVKDSAMGSTVVQHPNFDIDIAGSEELVMTTLISASARLVLTSDEPAQFTVFTQSSGVLVAEIQAEKDKPISLAVPRGRLLVQKRVGDHFSVAEVTVMFGDTYEVAPYDYEEVSYETFARRGASIDMNPNAIGIGYVTRGDRIGESWILRHGVMAGYERRFGKWSAFLDVVTAWARYASSTFNYDEITINVLAGVGPFFPIGPSVLSIGVGPVFLAYYQHRVRLDRDRIRAINLSVDTEERRCAFFPGGAVTTKWMIGFWRRLGFFLDARAYLMALSVSNKNETIWRVSPEVGGAAGFYYRF